MKKLILILTVPVLMIGCDKYDQDASAVGSGAGIEEVKQKEEASQDLNITTPIYDKDLPESEQEGFD